MDIKRKRDGEMTLDEAIRHCEEVAEANEKQASYFWGKDGNPNYEKCVECAEEHRQLSEWLKELKAYKADEEHLKSCFYCGNKESCKDYLEGVTSYACDDWKPCTDCISRQAVLDVIEREQFKGDAISEIEKLPPVTPAPKTGRWIDGKCSACHEDPLDYIECMGASNDAYIDTPMSYCPNCGAEMEGEATE